MSKTITTSRPARWKDCYGQPARSTTEWSSIPGKFCPNCGQFESLWSQGYDDTEHGDLGTVCVACRKLVWLNFDSDDGNSARCNYCEGGEDEIEQLANQVVKP